MEAEAARETNEACPWARESEWVELVALGTADASPVWCWATWRPEAAPSVSSDVTTAAPTMAAPIRLRRRHGRRGYPDLLICSRPSLAYVPQHAPSPALTLPLGVKKQRDSSEPFDGLVESTRTPGPVQHLNGSRPAVQARSSLAWPPVGHRRDVPVRGISPDAPSQPDTPEPVTGRAPSTSCYG